MKLWKVIAESKNYITRTSGWLSIINSIMIILTFKQVYNLKINATTIIIPGIILMLIIGYIDHKIIFPYQVRHMNTQNDIKDDIKKIKRKLNIE